MRIGEPDGNQATAAPSLTELGQAAAHSRPSGCLRTTIDEAMWLSVLDG